MEQAELYEKIPPSGWNQNNLTFIFTTPTQNRVIHPLVWLKWRFRFDDLSAFFSGVDNAAVPNELDYPTSKTRIAYRQGWCMSRAIQSIRCKINDKNIVQHTPSHYIDPLSRLYISREECERHTPGGAFDSDTMIADNPSDVGENVPNLTDVFLTADFGTIDNDEDLQPLHVLTSEGGLYNKGFLKRCGKFWKSIQDLNTSNYNLGTWADTIPALNQLVEIYEPIPILPFSGVDKINSGIVMPWAKKIEINISLYRDLVDRICFGRLDGAVKPTITLEEPEAYLRYVPFNEKTIIPPSMPVHTCEERVVTIDRTSNAGYLSGETNWLTYDISNTAPKLFFYIQRRDQDFESPTEHFLGIEELQIQTPRARVKLDAIQLYQMWRQESKRSSLTFEEWRSTKSVCILNKTTLNINRRIKIKAKWRNGWKIRKGYGDKEAIAIDDGEVAYVARLIFSIQNELYA
jgi:hypothetical protein